MATRSSSPTVRSARGRLLRQALLLLEATYIFEHLGGGEGSMISFIGQSHMMIEVSGMVERMQHLATAFFAYHLAGDADAARYVSEEFVSQQQELAWGVYQGE